MENRRIIIGVAGSSKAPAGTPANKAAKELGKALVDAGYRVLTGGGGGVMQAASRGAHMSKKYREGDTIAIIPSTDINDANAYADIVIPTGLSHYRNGIVASSKAVIIVSGGAGTLNEIAVAWQMQRLVIALTYVGGWGAEFAGKQLDACPRYGGEFEDKIWPAKSVSEAISILKEKLPLYNKVMEGIRYDHRIIAKEREPRQPDEEGSEKRDNEGLKC